MSTKALKQPPQADVVASSQVYLAAAAATEYLSANERGNGTQQTSTVTPHGRVFGAQRIGISAPVSHYLQQQAPFMFATSDFSKPLGNPCEPADFSAPLLSDSADPVAATLMQPPCCRHPLAASLLQCRMTVRCSCGRSCPAERVQHASTTQDRQIPFRTG